MKFCKLSFNGPIAVLLPNILYRRNVQLQYNQVYQFTTALDIWAEIEFAFTDAFGQLLIIVI